MNYRDNTKNLRQVGEELVTANILEGGVQRLGDRVRINVQLIDAKTDKHLWAQIYALQGKPEKALAELRKAIDSGWRGLWRYRLEHDPNIDSIRDKPEFQAMLDEIKAGMAAQLEGVKHLKQID